MDLQEKLNEIEAQIKQREIFLDTVKKELKSLNLSKKGYLKLIEKAKALEK